MPQVKQPVVQPGCVRLLEHRQEYLGGARVGLLVHSASVLPDLTYLHDRLIDDPAINVTALFGPEHGIAGVEQDQVDVGHTVYRGLRVYSLYGDDPTSLKPSPKALEKIDVLVIDLQGIGARYYTYVYTMAYCIEACAEAGKKVILCDRPNPINGLDVEGPVLDPAFASFVGRFPVPVRHARTVGELATQWNREQGWRADLTVLSLEGWERRMWFDETGLPWVMPSPNMTSLETATVYPGGCLIEGTNLSEGRGTTRPFEMVGAPWLDGAALAAELNGLRLPGVYFRPIQFVPTFHKFAGKLCKGVFVHVVDRDAFRSFDAYLRLVAAARRQSPQNFSWRTEPYEFERTRLAFDLLCGTDRMRLDIEAGNL
ncbi:MAG: DUF1343 domain-containing protein [Myxococcales bacterium]|nr:DUF1343 domain-containing protein [Myxococcales bacterium]